jgi:hypothetical protein
MGEFTGRRDEMPPLTNAADAAAPGVLDLPRLRTMARYALPKVIEGTLIPLGLFYAVLWAAGTWGAIVAALGWCYTALAWRVLTRRRVPGLLLIGAMGLTARTVVALASGSTFFYFLQPTLTTVVVAGVFLLSVPAGRPLAARLAADFFPLPPELVRRAAVRRVFARITVLWALVNLCTAAATLALLLTQPVWVYVAAKTGVSGFMVGLGVVVSTTWFRRTLNHERHNMHSRLSAGEAA